MNNIDNGNTSGNRQNPGNNQSVNFAASPKHGIRTGAFDKIAMILNVVLTFFFIRSVLFADFSSWKVTASYLGIFVLSTAYITVKQKKINLQAILSGLFCIVISLSFSLRENPYELQEAAVFALIYLSGSYCIALTGSNRHGRGSYFFLVDVLKTEVFIPLKHLFLPYAAMHRSRKEKRLKKIAGDKKTDKKYIAAIIGIVCAVPVLLIVVPLLLKGDAAFESVTGSFFEKVGGFFKNFGGSLAKINWWFGDNVFYLIPTVLVAPYIFSVMFSFRHSVSDEENNDKSAKYAKLRFGSPALFSGFLGVICLVYVIYILSQSAYFFSAFGGKLPGGTDISLAQYARRGFFELAGVAGVNLVVIAVTVLFGRRNNGKFNAVIKAFDLFLCAFNILLSAISMSKIVLYMNEMGLTHKRIYVFLIDLIMIVVFACVAIRLFNEKFPYMKVITATVCVVFTALCLAGIDGIIASHNAEKYLNGKIRCDDVYELFDGSRVGSFESCVKIAESKTKLSEKALSELYDAVKPGGYSAYFSCKNEKVSLANNDYVLNIDSKKALKFANGHVDTLKKALKRYDVSYEDGENNNSAVIKVNVLNNASVSIKSIALTLYDQSGVISESSCASNADESPIKSGENFEFNFNEKGTLSGGYYDLEITVTRSDGKIYSGTFYENVFSNEMAVELVSSGESFIAICDMTDSMIRLA